jgi:ABC-2 type transport system permease protein
MIQNPVLRKELLIRMRLRSLATAKAGVFALVMLAILWIHYEAIASILSSESSYRGRDEWGFLIVGQATLLFLLTPIAAANAITQEKEQQTWEMLVFTRLTSQEIVLGKLFARLVPSFGLLLLGFPLTLFSFWIAMQHQNEWSSLHAGNFVAVYLVLLICTVFFTITGLFVSWLVKRTLFAVMGSYVVVIGFLMLGTFLITGACSLFIRDYQVMERFPLLWINPIYMMGQAMQPMAPDGFLYMVVGVVAYLIASLLMLWIMVRNFHRSSNAVGA